MSAEDPTSKQIRDLIEQTFTDAKERAYLVSVRTVYQSLAQKLGSTSTPLLDNLLDGITEYAHRLPEIARKYGIDTPTVVDLMTDNRKSAQLAKAGRGDLWEVLISVQIDQYAKLKQALGVSDTGKLNTLLNSLAPITEAITALEGTGKKTESTLPKFLSHISTSSPAPISP